MDDGRSTMDDGRWTIDDGRWTMDDGRWTIDDGRTRLPRPGCGNQRERIHAGAVEAHAPVQMRTGDAPGRADQADDGVGRDAVACLDVNRRQMREHGKEPGAVIDNDGVAGEVERGGHRDRAVIRRADRRACLAREVDARVRRAQAPVVVAARAEVARRRGRPPGARTHLSTARGVDARVDLGERLAVEQDLRERFCVADRRSRPGRAAAERRSVWSRPNGSRTRGGAVPLDAQCDTFPASRPDRRPQAPSTREALRRTRTTTAVRTPLR